eukprot:COSAG01_NODE_617_length_14808_cov_8.352437_15_plen_31_part_01
MQPPALRPHQSEGEYVLAAMEPAVRRKALSD